jgi:hypothetical protein
MAGTSPAMTRWMSQREGLLVADRGLAALSVKQEPRSAAN